MNISRLDRYKGAMVGVLCGDALGAPYETWTAEKVLTDFTARGGLVSFDYPNPWKKETPNNFPKGRPTDDSDHTAALAESLIAYDGLNQEDLFQRLRKVVIGHESPLWDGRAVGAGRTTKNMLRPETFEESQKIPTDGDFPSNGSLMRSVPLALHFSQDYWFDPAIVRAMSEVTHRHPVAVECCIAYVGILVALLERANLTERTEKIKSMVKDPELISVLENPFVQPRDPEVWPGRGAAVLTLHVALWAFMNSTNFREGITKVIALGGDTDTYAAVAGGLLGARYGIHGIPQEWQDVLIGHQKMMILAEALYMDGFR